MYIYIYIKYVLKYKFNNHHYSIIQKTLNYKQRKTHTLLNINTQKTPQNLWRSIEFKQ